MRLLFTLLLSAIPAVAANHYIRSGATGAGAGNNWTDALTSIPSSLTRGDTYYIADGSYGSYTFNTPLSGTSTVTIKKATVADHGTSTGWSDAYGDGQATFGELTVNKGYLIFNGSTRNETTWTSGYGFRLSGISANSNNGDAAAGSSFSYCDVGATYSETPSDGYSQLFYMVYNQQNLTVSRCWFHNWVATAFQLAGARYITIEYCYLGPGWGKEAIRGGNYNDSDYFTIRYNRFRDACQYYPWDATSGITAEIAIWDVGNTYTGHEIYGNWFWNSKTGGRNGVILIANGSNAGTAQDCKVYNNTFVGIAESSAYGVIVLNGTGNEAYNNLAYNVVSNLTIQANSAGNNVTASSNPFVNYNNYDFHLTGATSAGRSLGSPYNTDPDGNTRGLDGVWDVGAFEYGGTPDPPTITSGDATWTNGISGLYIITFSGSASYFAASNLPAGLTCSSASGNITGTPTGTVTNSVILVAGGVGGETNKTVTFTVVPAAPILSIPIVPVSFALTRTNLTADGTFYVTNTGAAGTTLSGSVSNTAAPFSIVTDPATFSLSSGQSKSFTMRYSPTAVGQHSGTVAVNSNAGSNHVDLQGLSFPVTSGTNWYLTNSLVLLPMVKSNTFVTVTNTQAGYPEGLIGFAIHGMNLAAASTGAWHGTFIATNQPSGAAISFDAASSEHVENAASGETTPHSQGNLTDGYVVAAVGLWSAGDYDVTGATYDGSAMQLLAAHNLDYYGEYRVQIYGLAVGSKASGTYNFAITANGTLGHYNAGILSYSNVRQTDSVGTAVDGVGTNSTASLTVSSETGELVVMALVHDNEVTSVSSGETERVDTQPEADGESTNPDTLWVGTEPGAASVNIAAAFAGSDTYCATAIPLRATTNYGVNTITIAVNSITNPWIWYVASTNWDTIIGTNTVELTTSNLVFVQVREPTTWMRELIFVPDSEVEPDSTAPVVTITTPTNGVIMATTTTPLASFAGTASDNVGVTSCTCTNETTGVGYTVTGTTSWSVSNIALTAGTNGIRLHAFDAEANEGSDYLEVIYTPPVPVSVTNLRATNLVVRPPDQWEE